MKAAVYRQYGTPDVISIEEFQAPTPTDDEILIRVYASTVNRTDTAFRSATNLPTRLVSGYSAPKNTILGSEYAGIVERVGNRVKDFKEGDKVFGFNALRFGAHAQFICVKEADAVSHMPLQFSFERAAALTEGAHYAYCCIQAAGLRPNSSVLVYGATGAIGSAAVQLLVAAGHEVTAVCKGKHVELVKTLGANNVIDYESQAYQYTDKKYEMVLDAVGKSSFSIAKKALVAGGHYYSTELGANWQNIWWAIAGKFYQGKKVLFVVPKINKEMVNHFSKLAQQGKFRPMIDKYYDLDQIREAHAYVDSGQKIGNVVLRIPH